jgi:hypothetical protein
MIQTIKYQGCVEKKTYEMFKKVMVLNTSCKLL